MNKKKEEIDSGDHLHVPTDHVDSTFTKSFLIEWNHPFREIENLEIKVVIKDGQVMKKCLVCPSEKRGKSLFCLSQFNGKIISGSQLRQNESACEHFLNKTIFKNEDKCFRIFKIWRFLNQEDLPDHFRLIKKSSTESILSFVKRVEINLNAKKILHNHEKMDFYMDESLSHFFHSDDEFFMFEIKFFTHGYDREESSFLNNLELIFNSVTHLSFDAMVQRDSLIVKLIQHVQPFEHFQMNNSSDDFVKSLIKDYQLIRDLKSFLKLYVFFEFDGNTFEVMNVLNYLEIQ